MKLTKLSLIISLILSIKLNSQNICFSPATNTNHYFQLGGNTQFITTFDIDNNGNQDIIVGGVDSIYYRYGDGLGGFSTKYKRFFNGQVRYILPIDLDNNGFKDLIVAHDISSVSVLLNNSGDFFPTPSTYTASSIPKYIVSGDFNADSKIDIAVANVFNGLISVFEGSGPGTFTGPTNYNSTAPAEITSLNYFDINNDGKKDLVCTNSTNTLYILPGFGTSFSAATTHTLLADASRLFVNDFNSDSNDDFVTCDYNNSQVHFFINNGTPSSISYSQTDKNVSYRPNELTFADFNNDGKKDIATINDASGLAESHVSIFYNLGSGNFSASPLEFISHANSTLAGSAADFNNDGRADIAFSLNSATYDVNVNINTIFNTSISASSTTICNGNSVLITAIANIGTPDFLWNNSATTNTISVTPSSNTSYSVTSNYYSCSSGSSVNIVVNQNPSIFSISGTTFCDNAPGNINIAISGGVTPYSYTLSAPGGIFFSPSSGTAGSPINISSNGTSGAYSTTVNITDANNCSASQNQIITINPQPILSISGNTTICLGNTATLTASGATTYNWNTGSNTNQTIETPTINTTYTVTGILNGCTNTTSVNVTVNTPMPLTISPSNPTICATDIVNFSVSPNGTYTLVPGGMTGDLFNASPATTTTYTIESIDMNGCDNSETYTITVNPMPMLNISSNSPVCENANLSFTNSSSIASGSMTYFWEGPNGFTSTSSDPFLSPANTLMSGDYTLTATSDLGCSSIMNISATVNSLPIINASISSSLVCAGETVTLTASGAMTYFWSHNGDTNFETTDSPLGNTNYNVTGTDMNGCSNTSSVFVTVNTPSFLSFSPSTASICDGSTASFTVTPGGTYTISPGGQTGDMFSVSPSNSTSYTIDGYDMNGCYVTDIYNVTVNETPIAGGSSNNACVSGDIILFNSSSIGIGSMTYLWSGPNSFTTSVQTPTINSADLTMSGDYTLTVTSDLGCIDDAIISVTVNPSPTVNIGGPTSICAGTSATLTATGALSYTWSTTDNTSSIVITPTTSTPYTVEGEDANGCKNNAGTFISVDSPIPFSVSPSSPSICVGSSVNFTVSPTSTYTLNPGGTTGDNFNESPSVTTTYTIQGNDINGCDITNTYEIFVNPQPIAAANFNQAVICENNILSSVNTSTITGGSISSYAWNGPNSFSSSNANINISNATTLASGDYTLTVTSDQNCVDVAVISATVNPKPNVSATASATNICSSATATLTASGANTYTWSTSANTASIAVTPIAQTTYTVVGENAFACKDTATILINTIFSKNIDGIATSTTGTVSGEVTIYKFSPVLSMWDSLTTVNFNPNFNFGQLDSGNYVLRATPSATNIQTTYGNSSINWQNATILNHGCTANSSQTITLIPFENIGTGTGILTGTVVEGLGFGQRPSNGTSTMAPLAPGNPIGGIIVKGGKNPGGNMFTQTETDVNGTYTITGIPNTAPGESIFVFIDIPGLDTAGTYCRTFVNGESYTGLNFVVDSAKIRPVNPNQCLDVRISENSIETSLTIYPNPAKDVININFELNENANVSIELIDIIGRTTAFIENDKVYSNQKHQVSFNTKDIPNGVYLVKMKINNSEINRKIIISK